MSALKPNGSTAPDAGSGVPGGSGRITTFSFESKIFCLDGGFFSMTRDSKEPVFHVMLGELRAAVPLPTLRDEFKIASNSPDGKLLAIVERSLRFVKEIYPNDSVPRELLDGSASWSVEDRHRLIAQSRLAIQVSTWLSGEQTMITDVAELQRLADDPTTKQRVQHAIGEIAEKLGLGREGRQQVMDKIDQFARELSYIEGLRERCASIKQIVVLLNRLTKTYRVDKSVAEDIVRILQLLRAPVADFDATFDLIDVQTGQILGVLQSFNSQVEFVREMRNDLHERLMKWDDLLAKWQGMSTTRSPEAEALIKETYRFVAYNFALGQSWKR
jgi:hypothetical protein